MGAIKFLTEAHEMLTAGEIECGMTHLVLKLDELRKALSTAEWRRFCSDVALKHPVKELVHQDPFTRRSFMQPRGYPGDAELLDYIYGDRRANGSSVLGSQILGYSTNGHASQAVRERCDMLARLIDDVSHHRENAKIVSLACGHLREGQRAANLNGGRVGEVVAMDQDAESLSVVQNSFAGLPVRTLHASIRSLLTNRVSIHDADLVYAAGLFDYLADETARRLARLMFDMLAPGGRMLIANFSPSLRDIGYMEAFMRWTLLYRDASDVQRLLAEIPAVNIADCATSWDRNGCMVLVQLERRH